MDDLTEQLENVDIEEDEWEPDPNHICRLMENANLYGAAFGFDRQSSASSLVTGESQSFVFNIYSHGFRFHVHFFAWPDPIFIVTPSDAPWNVGASNGYRVENFFVSVNGLGFYQYGSDYENHTLFGATVFGVMQFFAELWCVDARLQVPLHGILRYLHTQISILEKAVKALPKPPPRNISVQDQFSAPRPTYTDIRDAVMSVLKL